MEDKDQHSEKEVHDLKRCKICYLEGKESFEEGSNWVGDKKEVRLGDSNLMDGEEKNKVYYILGVGHTEVETTLVVLTIVKSKGKIDMQKIGSCGKGEDIGPRLILVIGEEREEANTGPRSDARKELNGG